MDKSSYLAYVKRRASRSPIIKNCILAFLIGGLICSLGQALLMLYMHFGMAKAEASVFVTVSLIFLSAGLTGIGVFDRIARHAGAGTLVPVTGFANSVVSPAIDTKAEGLVLGIGSKIFTIAGPVLLYAMLSGCLYGVIYYIVSRLI